MGNEVFKSEAEIQEENLRARAKKLKRKQRVKKTIFYLIVLSAIAVIVWFAAFREVKTNTDAMNQQINVETKVVKDVYTVDIDLSGYVAPYEIQSATFRTTGPVVGVYVKEGDEVVKDQKLASIDSTAHQIALLEAENELKRAKLTGTENDIKLASMSLERAEKNLSYTDIVANFDGVVAKVNVNEGNYYEAGGSSVITVVDLSKLKATVEIDEIDMQYVTVGQKVSLTFDSLPGRIIEGYVSYIPMLGEYSSQGIGIVKVEITIDNPPESLTPGFSFEGKISVAGDVEMLLVAQSAITTGRGGVTTVTKKMEDGSTKVVNVTVKYLGEGYAQIVSGDVKEGDVLVYNQGTNSSSLSFMMGGGGQGGPDNDNRGRM